MIDIHSHLVFGVDDGAQTIQETQALLEDAVQQGITTMVATPHYRKGMFEASDEEVYEQFQQMCHLAQRVTPQLTLLLGREIYCHSSDNLSISPEWTLGQSNVLLLEFRSDSHYAEIHNQIYPLLNQNYRIVLAHIERYSRLTIEQIVKLRNLGCYIQVNASHVGKIRIFDKKRHIKKQVQKLLQKGLVDIVASDVHNTSSRPNHMQNAYQYILTTYGQATAEQLFNQTAQQLLR